MDHFLESNEDFAVFFLCVFFCFFFIQHFIGLSYSNIVCMNKTSTVGWVQVRVERCENFIPFIYGCYRSISTTSQKIGPFIIFFPP